MLVCAIADASSRRASNSSRAANQADDVLYLVAMLPAGLRLCWFGKYWRVDESLKRLDGLGQDLEISVRVHNGFDNRKLTTRASDPRAPFFLKKKKENRGTDVQCACAGSCDCNLHLCAAVGRLWGAGAGRAFSPLVAALPVASDLGAPPSDGGSPTLASDIRCL